MSSTTFNDDISLLSSTELVCKPSQPSSISLFHRRNDDESFTIDKLQLDKCELLGREKELEILQGKFQQAVQLPSKQIVLIGGEPGVGKSALALELRKSFGSDLAFYLYGKFKDDYNQPYGAIIEACDVLCDILASPPERCSFSRDDVQKELNRHLTMESLEMLEMILTSIKRLRGDLCDEKIQNDKEIPTHIINYSQLATAFHEAFSKFFKTASSFGTIVLVIDAVQWADEASIDLIEALAKDVKLDSLLLVVPYRTESMDESHGFRQVVGRLQQMEFPCAVVTELILNNVPPEIVVDFLKALILSSDEDIVALAKLVHFKTGGNMFYVKQFLNMLTATKQLVFEICSLKWKWNLCTIKSEAMATENVVSMILARLQEFPVEFQTLLPRAACLGTVFTSASFDIVVRRYCDDVGRLIRTYEEVRSEPNTNGTHQSESMDETSTIGRSSFASITESSPTRTLIA